MPRAYTPVKRLLDVLLAGTGLVVLSPLLLGLAAAVRLSSHGPAVFRQERMGRGARPFTLLKLRSMTTDEGGPSVTSAGDRRVTPLGRFLRRYKLDELPQLINVVRGDMSLVGPRPEVRRFVEAFPEAYAEVLTVRPGLTDYAAVAYRDEETILSTAEDPEALYLREVLPRKIELYREYIRTMSLTTDLRLILQTIAVIVRP
ncbi:MAG: sugar transferase [Anaeromyxobacter sp.]